MACEKMDFVIGWNALEASEIIWRLRDQYRSLFPFSVFSLCFLFTEGEGAVRSYRKDKLLWNMMSCKRKIKLQKE